MGVRAIGQTRPARTFWWDREPSADADVLRAVVFDADSALADIDRDGDTTPRAGLVDLVMSLFCAGIWVGVVSTRRRECVETLVRQVIGDGLVETIVTVGRPFLIATAGATIAVIAEREVLVPLAL